MRGIWNIPIGLTAVSAMAAVSTVAGPVAVAAQQPSSAAAVMRPAGGPAAARPAEVTLITGERVRLADGPGGVWSARIDPRYARPGVAYYERTVSFPGHRGDVLVIPSDVSSLISSGSLDENLFDVSQLARDGDSDAAGGTLRVTVTHWRRAAPARLPGTRGVSGAPGGGTRMTVAVPTARARQFWASLTRPAASRGQLALAPGIARVQLAGNAAPDAGAPARTAEAAAGDVTIALKGIDRNGQAVPGSQLATWSTAVNLATGKAALFSVSSSGAVTAEVAPGNYDLTTNIFTAAGASPASVTLADGPHISARHDVTVTFDARKAALLSAKVDRRIDDANVFASLLQKVHGRTFTFEAVSFFNSFQVYALPTPRVTGRPYQFLGQVNLDNGTPDPQKLGNATLTYSLMFPSAARIPAKLSFRVHDASLARVRQTFREQGKRSTFTDVQDVSLALEDAGFIAGGEFYSPAAGRVTELVTPGRWGTEAAYIGGTQPHGLFPEDDEVGPARTLRAGQSSRDAFGSAALGAASLTSRLGNAIIAGVLLDSASAPGHVNAAFYPQTGLTGSITLRRGTETIGTGRIFPLQNQPNFTVPAAAGRYTLSAVLHRHVAWSTLGTTARASWTFRSGHIAGHTPGRLQMWDIRIRGALDSLDRAPAGHSFSLTIAPDLPSFAPAARIKTVAVRASFNDGRTWRRLRLRPHGNGQWTTTVNPPRGSKFVSLSARLTDSAGNSTQQTVIRAYQLEPQAR